MEVNTKGKINVMKHPVTFPQITILRGIALDNKSFTNARNGSEASACITIHCSVSNIAFASV